MPGDDPLSLARAGSGGGYVGWAISNTLAQALGYEICAVILTLAVLWALIELSPLTVSEVALETEIGGDVGVRLGPTAPAGAGRSAGAGTARRQSGP